MPALGIQGEITSFGSVDQSQRRGSAGRSYNFQVGDGNSASASTGADPVPTLSGSFGQYIPFIILGSAALIAVLLLLRRK